MLTNNLLTTDEAYNERLFHDKNFSPRIYRQALSVHGPIMLTEAEKTLLPSSKWQTDKVSD